MLSLLLSTFLTISNVENVIGPRTPGLVTRERALDILVNTNFEMSAETPPSIGDVLKKLFRLDREVMKNWTVLEETCVEAYTSGGNEENWQGLACANFYPLQSIISFQYTFDCLIQIDTHKKFTGRTPIDTGITSVADSPCAPILVDWSIIVDACQCLYGRGMHGVTPGIRLCYALGVPNMLADPRMNAMRLLWRVSIWHLLGVPISEILVGAFERFENVMKNWVGVENFCDRLYVAVRQQGDSDQRLFKACQMLYPLEPFTATTACLSSLGSDPSFPMPGTRPEAIRYIHGSTCSAMLGDWKTIVHTCEVVMSDKANPAGRVCKVLLVPGTGQ